MKTQRLFKLCGSKGVSHHHLSLAEAQRQAEESEELESFIGRRGRLPVCPDSRSCWYREAVGRLTRSEASYVTSYRITSGFFG